MNKLTQIESLSGIRGFAVLLVLLSHASNHGISIHPDLSFSGSGRYGVFLFFVLSAFLLTRQFLVCAPNGKELNSFIKHYLLRRFLRIYPLFAASLFLYYLLNKLGIQIYNFTEKDLVKTIFLLDSKGIFWTIPVEFQYYFLLPIVSMSLVRVKRITTAAISISLFVAVWWLFFPPQYVKHLIPFLPIFVLGSGAAFISHRLNCAYPRIKHNVALWIFNFVATISFLAFFIFTPNFFKKIFSKNVGHTEFHEHFFLFSIISFALVLGVVHGNGFIKTIMESRFLAFWGNISFSAYLGHMAVLKLIEGSEFPAPLQWILFITLTAGLSYFAFKYFELPLSKIHNTKTIHPQTKAILCLTSKSR